MSFGNGRPVYEELDTLHVQVADLKAEDKRISLRLTNLDADTRQGLHRLDDTLSQFTGELVRGSQAAHETRERVKQLEGAVLQIAQALEALGKDAERKHAAMMRALKRNNSKPSNSSVRPVARKGK